MKTERQQNDDYIAQHWETMAPYAWHECRRSGPGALVLGPSLDPHLSIYVAVKVMATNPLLEDFVRLAETYDPRTEIVVIFVRKPSDVSAYKGAMPGRLSPVDLWARVKSLLHED